MISNRRDVSGHNLLEAIIAGMLFAAVTVSLMGVWDMQFKAMLKSKETAVASFLAERIMEECVAAGFENVDGLYPQASAADPYEGTTTIRSRTKKGETLTTYIIRVFIRDHPTDVTQKLVKVEVRYNDSTTKSTNVEDLRFVRFDTILNENG